MGIWTIEIAQKPTVVFAAKGYSLAETVAQASWLRGELMTLVDNKNKPLWDGVSRLNLRLATQGEKQHWNRTVDRPSLEESIDYHKRGDWLVFLLAEHDPAD